MSHSYINDDDDDDEALSSNALVSTDEPSGAVIGTRQVINKIY